MDDETYNKHLEKLSLTRKVFKWFNESMAKGRTLTQEDADFLRKVLVPEIKKEVTSDVKKLLAAQDIRNWGKMEELEEKFEKHTTKLKSDFLEKIDPILKEVKTAREERTLIESRLEALENIHRKGKHSLPPTV